MTLEGAGVALRDRVVVGTRLGRRRARLGGEGGLERRALEGFGLDLEERGALAQEGDELGNLDRARAVVVQQPKEVADVVVAYLLGADLDVPPEGRVQLVEVQLPPEPASDWQAPMLW